MKRLVKINAGRALRADDAREKTWAEIESMTMHLSRRDLHHKSKEGGSMSGLTLLVERYMRQLEEIEARAKETKHKLEVVMEASRLLAEEGMSEEGPSEHFQ